MAAGFPRIQAKQVLAFSLSILFILVSLPDAAFARKKRKSKRYMPYRSALVMDVNSGRVLRSYRPRRRIYPASVVKMMTTLVVMEHVRRKKVRLRDTVRVSRRAQRVGGQQVYLRRGERFRLEDLMKAVMITSANDAAYAAAEHVGGSVPRFVRLMNRRARQLGMTDSRFVNVNGLPERRRRPQNLMSARDASILARQLLKHRRVLSWTSRRTARFRGRRHGLVNTNRLMRRYPGMDGLKTGYYRRAGFSIVATAKRKNRRLISVVFGSRSSARRFREAGRLLSWGFSRYRIKNASVTLPKIQIPIRAGLAMHGETGKPEQPLDARLMAYLYPIQTQ